MAGAAWAMGDIYVSGTWRYKITVEVETPEGIKTGSAVHELSGSDSSIKILDLPEVGNSPEFRGEAVVVDMGKRGVVFAILPTDPYYMFYRTFYEDRGGATTIEGIKFFNSLEKGLKKDLGTKDYPQFVMFKDIDDPKTVTLVKGARFDADRQEYIPVDNFEKIFGPGVKLKNITLEITDEPVTWGIEKWLPWLPDRYRGNIDGSLTTNSAELSNNLNFGNFKKGGVK